MCEPRDVSGGDDERSKSMHVLVISITKVKKIQTTHIDYAKLDQRP